MNPPASPPPSSGHHSSPGVAPPATDGPGEFLAGVGYLWRGFSFLAQRPALWLWAVIPFILNLLLFGAIVTLTVHHLGGWIEARFLGDQPLWLEAIGWLLRILLWLLMLLIVVYCFVPVATLVASPFNDLLSERVERLYTGRLVDETGGWAGLPRSLWLGLKTSLRLTAQSIGLLACTIPFYFVPLIGQLLGPGLAAAVTIRFLSLEHTSYSMDRRLWDFPRRQHFLRRNRMRTLGMGSMAFVVMMIPILNALFIPVSAVAGTLLFCDGED